MDVERITVYKPMAKGSCSELAPYEFNVRGVLESNAIIRNNLMRNYKPMTVMEYGNTALARQFSSLYQGRHLKYGGWQ